MLESLLAIIFPSAMVVAASRDLLTFTIPNWISVILFFAFIFVALAIDLPWPTLLVHIAIGFFALILGFIVFTRGWIGGGDAKLMAAAALWVGLDHLLPFVFWTALLGGALSIVLLTYRRILPPLWLLGQSWAMRLHDPKEGIPYGVAIAGAALIVYPSTGWMTGFAG